MDPALTTLIERMPPPKKPPPRVDWDALEEAIGLPYPSSFKEFAGTYGACRWCDHFAPLLTNAKSPTELKSFLRTVKTRLKYLVGNTYTAKFEPTVAVLYPESGGLYPFGMDLSGCQYLWQTSGNDPDRWPIVCWLTGQLLPLGRVTVAEMLLAWMDRRKWMREVWGDIRDLPPERIRLDE